MRSLLSGDQFSLVVYNVHHYGVLNDKFKLFQTSVHKDLRSATVSHCFLILAGDFNVAKEGDNDVDHDFPFASSVPRSNYGLAAKAVNDIFPCFVEIQIGGPTHYTKSSGRLSFIDRLGFSTPSWVTKLLARNSSHDFLTGNLIACFRISRIWEMAEQVLQRWSWRRPGKCYVSGFNRI